VGQIQSAERIQGADKLLKLMVDIGDDVRQVLAGIATGYAPEELVGRKVVLVANLAPRKMRGLESNGMLLAASAGADGKPVLCTFAEEIPPGAKVK
jgi:methionyl-tRNA synthetase